MSRNAKRVEVRLRWSPDRRFDAWTTGGLGEAYVGGYPATVTNLGVGTRFVHFEMAYADAVACMLRGVPLEFCND